jgi:SAM-dependent methyltransferase
MKELLNRPALYQLYQELGGFFSARVYAIRDYLRIEPRARIIDIGCGPGHIVRHLPGGIDYVGLDIDSAGIEYAKTRFGHLGQFKVGFFDAAAAREFGPVDIVMMNGVMHHIPDDELAETLGHVRSALKDDGVLFTLDGCYAPGQSRIAKWLLDNDRGVHVRDQQGYRGLLEQAFPRVALHIRDDYSRLPYTFAIGVAHKHG